MGLDIEVRDSGAFLSALAREIEQPAPEGGPTFGPARYELRGRARADDIRIELVRFPRRSTYFVFAPTFLGRLTPDGGRVVGRFRSMPVQWILAAVFLVWLVAVPGPTIASVAAAGFPSQRVLDEVLPVLAGILAGCAVAALARFQSRRNRRRMERVLREAARA